MPCPGREDKESRVRVFFRSDELNVFKVKKMRFISERNKWFYAECD